MIKDLILKNRSYRRFDEAFAVSKEELKDMVDLARLSASSANLQPLRYILSTEPEMNALIFACLKWAGYLKQWPGPPEGERPPAYILILGDLAVCKNFGCDHGIAAQSMLLGLAERGLGGCIIASIDREKLRKNLRIPERYEILLALAVGRPVETVKIETVGSDGSVKYWRDGENVHHVPKRRLADIILNPSEWASQPLEK